MKCWRRHKTKHVEICLCSGGINDNLLSASAATSSPSSSMLLPCAERGVLARPGVKEILLLCLPTSGARINHHVNGGRAHRRALGGVYGHHRHIDKRASARPYRESFQISCITRRGACGASACVHRRSTLVFSCMRVISSRTSRVKYQFDIAVIAVCRNVHAHPISAPSAACIWRPEARILAGTSVAFDCAVAYAAARYFILWRL